MRGAGADSLNIDFAFPLACSVLLRNSGCVPRTRRTLLGNWVDEVGVAGRTLIEVCGDREIATPGVVAEVGVLPASILLEDMEEVLECECA